jgi:hypothetical protein
MQISIPIQQYNIDNVCFCNRTDNTVINGGEFYRLMYCNENVSMLGVHLLFEVDVSLGSSHEYDIKDVTNKINEKTLSVVSTIVNQIHKKWLNEFNFDKTYPNCNSITLYNIEQTVIKSIETYKSQFKKGVKIPFILKCSGIYVSDYETGISFRLSYN